jgi:hypothetical protein
MATTKTKKAAKQTNTSPVNEYENRVEGFRSTLASTFNTEVFVDVGRKYDKLYTVHGNDKTCHYMVEKATENIYGVKSWAMINTRRMFGSLSTVAQYSWDKKTATPLSGTEEFDRFNDREKTIVSGYKKRGRPRKAAALSTTTP